MGTRGAYTPIPGIYSPEMIALQAALLTKDTEKRPTLAVSAPISFNALHVECCTMTPTQQHGGPTLDIAKYTWGLQDVLSMGIVRKGLLLYGKHIVLNIQKRKDSFKRSLSTFHLTEDLEVRASCQGFLGPGHAKPFTLFPGTCVKNSAS